jgi:hypothetical protein
MMVQAVAPINCDLLQIVETQCLSRVLRKTAHINAGVSLRFNTRETCAAYQCPPRWCWHAARYSWLAISALLSAVITVCIKVVI